MLRSVSISPIALLAFLIGPASAEDDSPKGYLAGLDFDVAPLLQPAPQKGDPRYEADRKIFRATRRLEGTARWDLAKSDVDYGVPAMLRNYSCAVGVVLSPENAPRLVSLANRAGIDTLAQTDVAKAFYRRDRPFVIDRGATCQPVSELYDGRQGRMSFDYPSGHATWGWTWALILASAVPDRAQSILERGRAYADSRYVCGAHNASAVEAGLLSASATMTLVQTRPDYQADLAAVREELSALRSSGQRPRDCDVAVALVRDRVMPRLN